MKSHTNFVKNKNLTNKEIMGVLVGKKAPLFSASAVVNGNEIVDKYSLQQFIGNR